MRRRSGGADAGWHLKLPLAEDRDEVQLPLDKADDVPAALLELVAPALRGAAVAPIGRILTTRAVRTVSAPDRTPLVEVADDRVRAERLARGLGRPPPTSRWREIEAELLPGAPAGVLAEVAELLTAAGAWPASSASKLARLLDDLGDDRGDDGGAGPAGASDSG